MQPFEYTRPADTVQAIGAVSGNAAASFLAGGTTQLDLMKDGVLRPAELVDITSLPLRGISRTDDAIRVGALTTMEELAADRTVVDRVPLVRQALLLGASVQLRNMATIGGNLLQRARCRYFRDPTVTACNKRDPGSGCAAVANHARMHAILGVSERCIALHASDLAVALVALDAVVHTQGQGGNRRIPLTQFYREAGASPHDENVLDHGELIVSIEIPLPPPGIRSTYLKVRDRSSYEFALSSAAAMMSMRDGVIAYVRLGLGGVGSKPWRAGTAERILAGAPATNLTFRAAADIALEGAWTVPGTAFKVELAKRTIVRALQTVSGDQP
jgi:xanthine dehydrogenase YagS FAD-binding subunit